LTKFKNLLIKLFEQIYVYGVCMCVYISISLIFTFLIVLRVCLYNSLAYMFDNWCRWWS